MSQAGLLPIVEIPYAKYLDCGYDMFLEIGLTYWLSNGRQRDGLVVRVQGFDRGKFGGNFHTHNMVSLPPGVDAVCYSNGGDYVRGMRNCLRQALAGRVVMSFDSTDLLNRRHLGTEDDGGGAKDDLWLTSFPNRDSANELAFDDVIVYRGDWLTTTGGGGKGPIQVTPLQSQIQGPHPALSGDRKRSSVKLLIVTYGNGLPNSLQAMGRLIATGRVSSPQEIAVIDCPYLSSPPQALKDILSSFQISPTSPPPAVLFADVCKEGPGMVHGGYVVSLQNDGLLPTRWRVIGSQATYNPLGQTLTFLSSEDVERAASSLLLSVSSPPVEAPPSPEDSEKKTKKAKKTLPSSA
jgi:hypothetical protein